MPSWRQAACSKRRASRTRCPRPSPQWPGSTQSRAPSSSWNARRSRARSDPDALLLDARAPERYRGDVEPIDPRAGHIPTAVNAPFSGNLADGRFLAEEALRERYRGLGAWEKATTVYCGSGVTACHDLLALAVAGLPSARLYAGSWSEWCRAADAPVAVGG